MVKWESSRRLLTELLESIFCLFPLFTHTFCCGLIICVVCFLVELRVEYETLKFRDVCSVCLGASRTPCPHTYSPVLGNFHSTVTRLYDHAISLWLCYR